MVYVSTGNYIKKSNDNIGAYFNLQNYNLLFQTRPSTVTLVLKQLKKKQVQFSTDFSLLDMKTTKIH